MVKVINYETEALIDSGAGGSLCSENFWGKVSSIISHPQLRAVKNIVLLDYTATRRTKVREDVSLHVQINKVETFCSFRSVKRLNQNLLIGRDIMA